MSIFGQGSGAPSSGSTLFNSLNLPTPANTDPANRKRSIFDNLGTSQPQSQAPQTSSLFSGATGLSGLGGSFAATSAPSMFNLKPPTTSTPAATNVFGNPTTSAPSTGFLSGSTLTPSQPPKPAFGFAAQNTQQPSNPLQTNPAQSQLGQSSSLQPSARDPAHFSSLLERQKKRVRLHGAQENGRASPFPAINMDLDDLARRAQEIGGRAGGASGAGPGDSRAHYLLAGSGVTPGKAYKEFEALRTDPVVTTTKPAKQSYYADTGKYITDLQQKGRETMRKENMARVHRDVDAFIEQTLGIDFEEQKQRIMEHFGLVRPDENAADPVPGSQGQTGSFGHSTRKGKATLADSASGSTRSVFGRSALDKSLIGTPGMNRTTSFFGEDAAPYATGSLSKGQTARDLRDKERLFMEKVEKLNKARIEAKVFPIMHEFALVEQAANGDSPKQLFDAYQALQEITKENAKAKDTSDPAAIKERQFAAAYVDDGPNSARAIKLKRQIIDGSRTFLEKAFYKDLEALVEKNPREAQLGGRPTVINKVRAYIRVRAARKDLAPDGSELQQIGENGDYCWILIFYLLRSGFVNEAAEYVNNDPAFQSTDKRFISYLTTYKNSSERRLGRKLQEMISGEYQQRLRIAPEHSVDPYRMACYKIIGRCDLARRNLDAVGQGVEDWIWLQFSLAREFDPNEELAGENFGLDHICETVREIGQKHFGKGQAETSGGYGTFFFMQILCGMFEQGIEYLHAYNPVSAVHFAIALAYYGLLRVSDYTVAGNELLTLSSTQQPLINYVPLIAYYTATFRTALPVAAVDYLCLICLNSDLKPAALGNAQTAACHECLRQLCLETREFARLLGDIRSDGSRIAGAIEQKAGLVRIETHDDFLKAVTLQAAAVANERGQVADAVLLYHLCEDYDNVIGILNQALADAVTLDLGESAMKLQPLKPRREKDSDASPKSSQDGPQSSLSLTQSTSSPVELAKNMISLYNDNAAYYNQISTTNRKTCGALLQLLSARSYLEANPPRFMQALEELNELNILPLQAQGAIPIIRAAASAFGALPQILARCAGVSVVWAVRAIGGERDNIIRQGSWDGGASGDRDAMKEQLSSMAKDLMVFAGLVKYKLPGRVYDMLTRAGGDVGGY